jgi:hypothetical protein
MAEPHPIGEMTAEELFALPEDARRHELQAGFLVEEPRPVFRHQLTLLRCSTPNCHRPSELDELTGS